MTLHTERVDARAVEAFSITEGIAQLRLATGKANAIAPEFLTSLHGLLDRAAAEGARALTITGHERYFSGGLALPFIAALDRAGMAQFMEDFHATIMRLFTWPTPVVAAINGHAIAGGCVLALQADVRIMSAEAGKIGLNEAQLGIGLPSLVLETLRAQVPASALLPIALEGQLLAPDDARAHGLVHEVVAAEELEPRALARARELAALPAHSFALIKQSIRRAAVEVIDRTAQADSERWLDSWFSPTGRAVVDALVAKLSATKG